jgi:hypothetical protein
MRFQAGGKVLEPSHGDTFTCIGWAAGNT